MTDRMLIFPISNKEIEIRVREEKVHPVTPLKEMTGNP